MALTKNKELQLLRDYFRASEYRRAIGEGNAMKYNSYPAKVGEMNQQFNNMKRKVEELSKQTNLLDFIKNTN